VSSPSSDFFSGAPIAVDPEQIDRELARLWKPVGPEAEGSSAVTRACLSNVIFFLPDAESCARARDLLLGVGRRFPSRMILLTRAAAPDRGDRPRESNGSRLSASVTAVCHISSPGAAPVCCEQIQLEANDGVLDVFPGAVAPLLVPDVPVSLIVLCAGGEDLVRELRHIVDQVILDSRGQPVAALERALAVLADDSVCGVDDLAWRDTIGWRRIICDVFDDPTARALLEGVRSVEVVHRPGSPVRAALIAGWLASRLGRKLVVTLSARGSTDRDPGEVLSVRLLADGAADPAYIAVSRMEGSSLLKIESHTRSACGIPRTIPFRHESDAELLGGALEHRTHQGVLRAALHAALQKN
jgi:glucose-6-phosphate dehydrogenase assembly protein OpcA